MTGGTGWGLSCNLNQPYGEVARVYAPAGKIFLFERRGYHLQLEVDRLARKTLWSHPWSMAWLVVTLWLGLAVDRRLDRAGSRF